MLLVVVILLASLIVIPLIELASNETIQRLCKILVYALVFLWVGYQLVVSKVV